MKEKTRIGIIGTGNIGHCHMEAYRKLSHAEVVAVCDINIERAKAFAELYGVEKVFSNHQSMLCECNLDAVSVCTWNNCHASISIDALEKGVHVLCEKPLAMNFLQAVEMEQAAIRNSRVLMPGFCTRYEEGVNLLKSCIDDKRLGKIYFMKATYLRRHGNPGGWFSDKSRSGGGPIIDLGVHVLDLARYLVGGNAVAVTAFTNKMPIAKGDNTVSSHSPHVSVEQSELHDVEDFAFALIQLDNGASIQFETSWNHHIHEDVFQFEVFGTSGGAKAYPKVVLTTDELTNMCTVLFNHSNHEDSPNFDFDQEIAHFISVTQGEQKPICTATDGVEAMKIIDAIYKSAATHHQVCLTK